LTINPYKQKSGLTWCASYKETIWKLVQNVYFDSEFREEYREPNKIFHIGFQRSSVRNLFRVMQRRTTIKETTQEYCLLCGVFKHSPINCNKISLYRWYSVVIIQTVFRMYMRRMSRNQKMQHLRDWFKHLRLEWDSYKKNTNTNKKSPNEVLLWDLWRLQRPKFAYNKFSFYVSYGKHRKASPKAKGHVPNLSETDNFLMTI